MLQTFFDLRRCPFLCCLLLAVALPAHGQIAYVEPPDLAGQSAGTVTAGLNTIQGSVGVIVIPSIPTSGDPNDPFTVQIPASLAITHAELIISNFSLTTTAAAGRLLVTFPDQSTIYAATFTDNATFTLPVKDSISAGWLGTAGTQSFHISADLEQPGSIAFTYQLRLTVQLDVGACCAGGLGGACSVTSLSGCGNGTGTAQWLLGATCSPNICPQTNDRCSQAIALTAGSHPFSTVNATTDGKNHPAACTFFGASGIAKDIWYSFIMPQTGIVSIDTCGSSFDTELAVYSPTICPGSDATLLACNDDDGTLCTPGADHSRVSGLALNAGQACLIRVGGYDGGAGGGASGAGTLTIATITTGACCNRWTGHCLATTQADCVALGLRFAGFGSVCSPATCHACPADFNGSGSQTIDDLFLYLNAYFVGCP